MLWLVLSVCAAVFMTIYFAEVKELITKIDRMSVIASIFTLVGVLFFGVSWMTGMPEAASGFPAFLMAAAFSNVVATLFFTRALQITDLSLAIPMVAFTPLFLLVTSPFILGEYPSLEGVYGVLLICAGSYILNLNERHDILSPIHEMTTNRGIIYMLLASFFFSMMAGFNKLAITSSDVFLTAASNYTLAGAIFLILALVRKSGRESLSMIGKWKKRTILFTVTSVFFAATMTYTAWGMQLVSYVLSVQRLSILFSVMIGGLFLHEKAMEKRLTGAVLMVVGVVLMILNG